MCSIKPLSSLAIAALLASVSAHPADDSVVIAHDGDKQTASFKIGASQCVLKDDQIRCVRVPPVAPSKYEVRSDGPARSPTASRRGGERTPVTRDQVSTVTSPFYAEVEASDPP
jgi:hypothetical protein